MERDGTKETELCADAGVRSWARLESSADGSPDVTAQRYAIAGAPCHAEQQLRLVGEVAHSRLERRRRAVIRGDAELDVATGRIELHGAGAIGERGRVPRECVDDPLHGDADGEPPAAPCAAEIDPDPTTAIHGRDWPEAVALDDREHDIELAG